MTNGTAGAQIPGQKRGSTLEASVDVGMWLATGDYFLTVSVADPEGPQHDLRNDALHFTLAGTPTIFTTSIVNVDARYSFK